MRANKHLLLWSSIGTLAVLVWAASGEMFFQEWRRTQVDYRRMLPAPQSEQFRPLLRQVVVPSLKATDRCVTCHVGMAAGETPVAGSRVYGAHPPVVHDPGEFGCTVCHGGQGRATTTADAHGTVPHWPEPMLPAKYSYAGCGGCHTHVWVPDLAQLKRGETLFARYDCLRCHALDGRGGTLRPNDPQTVQSPDLSTVGATGFDPDWYRKHRGELPTLAENQQDTPTDPQTRGPQDWRLSFGEIPEDHRAALDVFLSSRVAAGRLIESKALFHSLGCRGCHKINEVGGDDGPDLSRAGLKDPGQLDFSRIPGEPTLANWMAEHFRAPAAVVEGSLMPAPGLSEKQIDDLVFYTLSLRRTAFPEAYWPRDRIRAQYFDAREFAVDGATLYGTFCAACHGRKGEGIRYPGFKVFPAVANPDFLALASDQFIESAVRRGRPGERMPAWGGKEGGLRPEEVKAVVQYVRSLGGSIQAIVDDGSRWVRGDVDEGRRLYDRNCVSCHGVKGQGAEGPALGNPVFLETASDTYLVESIRRGRRGTTMPSFARPSTVHRALADAEIESVVSYIRTWEDVP